MKITIDKNSKVPLYKQVANAFIKAIEVGEYTLDVRLPAEAKLASDLGVAQGTIKKAYEILQNGNYIKKVRGAGAYVKGREGLVEKHPKEVIRELYEKLEGSGLTMKEIYWSAREKSMQFFKEKDKLVIALIEENKESVSKVIETLKEIEYVEVVYYPIEEILMKSQKLDTRCRLILSSKNTYAKLLRFGDENHLRVEEYVLKESREIIRKLTTIPDGRRLCIVYRSQAFLKSIQELLEILGKTNPLTYACEGFWGKEVEEAAKDGDTFIVPPDYVENSYAKTLQLIERGRKSGSVIIPFSYEVDTGSFYHLKQVLLEYFNGEEPIIL